MNTSQNPITAGDLYQSLVVERQVYLEEAYRSAKVTIPALVPDAQDICTRSTPVVLEKPFQSLGARGTNNLASKLLMALFPPTAPFMKYVLTGTVRDEAAETGESISELQALLSRREARIQDEVDLQGVRVKGFQTLRLLLVSGNAMEYHDPVEGGVQIFPLNSYVVKRDGRGNLLDLVYVEKLSRRSIEDERVLEILAEHPESDTNPQKTAAGDEPVLLFTHVQRVDSKKFRSYQEVNGVKVKNSEDEHRADKLPWLVLRLTSIDGEDYGRGFVEEYRGDLTSYEQLSRDMDFASANAAKVVWGISPNAALKPRKFMEVPNGGAVQVDQDDIHAIRLDKGGDMSVVKEHMRDLKSDLQADFMLNSSFQRHQERVTAEEIRLMAQELDDSLGGLFSLLSSTYQLPKAQILEDYLERKPNNGFPSLPEDTVRIGVVTGLAAIGRGQELQRLREATALVAEAAQVLPGLPEYINEEDYNRRIWTGSGVDTEGLLKTADEVAQERQAAQQAQQAQGLTAELAKGAGKIAGNVPPEVAAQALVQ